MKTVEVKITGSASVVGMPFAAAMQGTMGDWYAVIETPEAEEEAPAKVRFWNRAGFYGVATWLITVIVALVVVL